MTASSVKTGAPNMDLTCDESMPTDNDIDPNRRLQQRNNNQMNQISATPLNFNLQPNVNLNVNQLSFPNIPLISNQVIPNNFITNITNYQILEQQIKLAQALSQQSQNILQAQNLMLPQQSSIPANLLTNGFQRPQMYLPQMPPPPQQQQPQQQINFNSIAQASVADQIEFLTRQVIQNRMNMPLPHFSPPMPAASLAATSMAMPVPMSTLSTTLSIPTSAPMQMETIMQQQHQQPSTSMPATVIIQPATQTPFKYVTKPPVTKKARRTATPKTLMQPPISNSPIIRRPEASQTPRIKATQTVKKISTQTPAVSVISSPPNVIASMPLPTSSKTPEQQQASTSTATIPEVAATLPPEPEPEPEPIRSNMCDYLDIESYIPGVNKPFQNHFSTENEIAARPRNDFGSKRIINFISLEKYINACRKPALIIDLIRKGYKMRVPIIEDEPSEDLLKAANNFISIFPECVWQTTVEDGGNKYFEILLKKIYDEERRKVSKAKLVQSTAACFEKAAQKNLSLRQGDGGRAKSVDSEGRALAAVFTAANVSPAKNQNISTVVPINLQPSTSSAISVVQNNTTADFLAGIGCSEDAALATRKRQRKQQFEFISPQERIKVLGTVPSDKSVETLKFKPNTSGTFTHRSQTLATNKHPNQFMVVTDPNIPSSSGLQYSSQNIFSSANDNSSNTNFKEADLLLYFSKNTNENKVHKKGADFFIPSNFSQVRHGIQAFKKQIKIQKAKPGELRNPDFTKYLPEAISLNNLEEDPRNGKIIQLPKFFNTKSILWNFGPDHRKIGILPSKKVTVVETIPLPFKADHQEMSDLNKVLKEIDAYSHALTLEQFSVNQKIEKLSKSLIKLNFHPPIIKPSKYDNLLSVKDLIPTLKKNLRDQNWHNFDPVKFINTHLPKTQLELLKEKSKNIENAICVQTYFSLLKLHRKFPKIFNIFTEVLVKFQNNKGEENSEFIRSMKKLLLFKEKLIELVRIFDQKTKGKKSAEECLSKALEKLNTVLNVKNILDTVVEPPHQDRLSPVLEEVVEEKEFNIKAIFPETDEFYQTSKSDAFKIRQKYLKEAKPFQLISPKDCEGKNRRIAHRFPNVKWHVSQNGIITAYKIDKQIYSLIEQRKYYDTKIEDYVYPPTAKIISSKNSFFDKKHNLSIKNISSKVADQAKRFEKMEDSFYERFEKASKISNQIHSICLENIQTFFPFIYQALKETMDVMIGKENKQKRLFVELHFLMKGTEWARRLTDKVHDGPAEGLYPIKGNDNKVVELFLRMEEWFDVLFEGSEDEKLEYFSELTQLKKWKENYRNHEMRQYLRMDPDGIFHFPEIFDEGYKTKTSQNFRRINSEQFPLDDKNILDVILKLRMATKDRYLSNIKHRVKAQEQASKIIGKVEDYMERRTRASTILFTYAEATCNFTKPLPDSIANAFKNPIEMLTQEAVLINRGHVPPRIVTENENHKANDIDGATNIDNFSSEKLLEEAIRIRKCFNLVPENEKQNGKADDWMNIDGDLRKDTVLYNPSACLDFCKNPQKEAHDIALNTADLNERELTEIVYKQYIEANRSCSMVNRVKEMNQRLLCYYRREDYRNQVYDFIVKSKESEPCKLSESLKNPGENVEFSFIKKHIAANIEKEKIEREKRKIESQIHRELKHVSSNRIMDKPTTKTVFRSPVHISKVRKYQRKIDSLKKSPINKAKNRKAKNDINAENSIEKINDEEPHLNNISKEKTDQTLGIDNYLKEKQKESFELKHKETAQNVVKKKTMKHRKMKDGIKITESGTQTERIIPAKSVVKEAEMTQTESSYLQFLKHKAERAVKLKKIAKKYKALKIKEAEIFAKAQLKAMKDAKKAAAAEEKKNKLKNKRKRNESISSTSPLNAASKDKEKSVSIDRTLNLAPKNPPDITIPKSLTPSEKLETSLDILTKGSSKASAKSTTEEQQPAPIKLKDSNSSNSPELGTDFGTFMEATSRRSNDSKVLTTSTSDKADTSEILLYEGQMPGEPLIIEGSNLNNEDLPSPIMEEDVQVISKSKKDLPDVKKETVENGANANNIRITTMSVNGVVIKRGRGRPKINVSESPLPSSTVESPVTEPKKTYKKRGRPKLQQPSTNSPSSSDSQSSPPSIPKKRGRKKLLPLLPIASPKKKKKIENQENTAALNPVERGPPSPAPGPSNVPPIKIKKIKPKEKSTLLSPKKKTKIGATEAAAVPSLQKRPIGRPRKLIETNNLTTSSPPSASKTTPVIIPMSPTTTTPTKKPESKQQQLGKRVIKKRISLSPEPPAEVLSKRKLTKR